VGVLCDVVVHRCEILMSGSGHKDWVGGVQISPNGFMLGSSSGDGLVKLWDFRKGLCVSTLQDHQQPGTMILFTLHSLCMVYMFCG
jgi:WD40 repeat protein